MNFSQLLQRALILESDREKYLGRDLEKLSPRGMPTKSSMPDLNIEPEPERFKRGTYIDTDAELPADVKHGSESSPESVQDAKDAINRIIESLSKVENGALMGPLVEIIDEFAARLETYRSAKSMHDSMESTRIKDTDLSEYREKADEARSRLNMTVVKCISRIKALLKFSPNTLNTLDEYIESKGRETMIENQRAVLQDFMARLKSRAIKRSDLSVTGVKKSASQQMGGDKKAIATLIKNDRTKRFKVKALDLAGDNDEIKDLIERWYSGNVFSERDFMMELMGI